MTLGAQPETARGRPEHLHKKCVCTQCIYDKGLSLWLRAGGSGAGYSELLS